MEFLFDRIEGMRANETQEMVEVVRPCLVRGIPVVDGATGTDPEVLFKMRLDPQCPARGSLYPTTILPYARATLQEFAIRSRLNATSAIVDFIYRAKATLPGGAGIASNWSLSRSPQISHIQTYHSFDGQSLNKVWFKDGTAAGTTSEPSGADDYVAPVTKMRVNSVLTARALLSGDDWRSLSASIREIEEHLNSTVWGTDDRGVWFFVGPTTQTNDYGSTYSVELTFLENKDGWYPLAIFFDKITGQHPKGADKESSFTAFPAPGNIITINGLTRVGEYGEVDFNAYFAFTPDDV